jgi:hypothetical protein
MLKEGVRWVVMEVSAHALYYKKVLGIPFRTCIFTNLTQDHLDFFKDKTAYAKTKMQLFAPEICQTAIVNTDDETGRAILLERRARGEKGGVRSVTYGLDSPADAFAILTHENLYGSQCMLNINGTAKSLGWNSYSDIRKKDVINPVTASVEDIANVRIFDFRWKKDGENGKIHFGSAAQDWQPIFPHAVVADNEGFLSMDYAGIAVGAVKTVAQEVVLLKKRVAELEKQLKAS